MPSSPRESSSASPRRRSRQQGAGQEQQGYDEQQERQVEAAHLVEEDDGGAQKGQEQAGSPRRRVVQPEQRGERQDHQELGGDDVRVAAVLQVPVGAAGEQAVEGRGDQAVARSPQPAAEGVEGQRRQHEEGGDQDGEDPQRLHAAQVGELRHKQVDAGRVQHERAGGALGDHHPRHYRVLVLVVGPQKRPVPQHGTEIPPRQHQQQNHREQRVARRRPDRLVRRDGRSPPGVALPRAG